MLNSEENKELIELYETYIKKLGEVIEKLGEVLSEHMGLELAHGYTGDPEGYKEGKRLRNRIRELNPDTRLEKD